MNFKQIDFVKHRKKYFLITGIMFVLGILSLSIMGLNLGVDFESGTRLDILIGQTFAEEDITAELDKLGIKGGSVTTAGADQDTAVIRFPDTLNKDELAQVRTAFQDRYGEQVDLQSSTVEPTVSRDLAQKALYAVLLASVFIIIYVTIRFEFRFAISAIIALLHDAFFVIALFSILRIEVDLPFIAAVLTIVGYSINDTIVVFDRIRENLKKAKVKRMSDLEDVVNDSVRQTIVRSINTSLTVVVAALALVLLGGESLRNFSLAILVGLIAGTYSSIFIASQIWLEWKGRAVEKQRFDAANNEV